MLTEHATAGKDTSATVEPSVIWPEPSPLDMWWTEIMDGVPPPHQPR
ncbi:hypothetical protein ACFU44_17295 [Nocardia rhizosphaerihabitans]